MPKNLNLAVTYLIELSPVYAAYVLAFGQVVHLYPQGEPKGGISNAGDVLM